MVTLNDVQKASLFKMCGDKPFAEVGFEYGLDKKYKDVATMKVAVSRIYNEVKNNPEKFGVSYELVNDVVNKIEERKVSGLQTPQGGKVTIRERTEILNPQDIKGLVVGGRNKAAKLMNEKLDRIARSKKALDELDLGRLATVLGILVDKAQVLQGQSTENIAILSKNIDSNLSPEEAIAEVMRRREATIAERNEDK